MNKFLKVAALGLVMALSAPSAQAALINFSLDGEILTVEDCNLFGLSVGDVVTVHGTFDDAAFTGSGSESIKFANNDPTNVFDLWFGNFLIDNTMDINFLDDTFPLLVFQDGVLQIFDYVLVLGINGAPFDLGFGGLNFSAFLDNSTITGVWDAESFTTSVPEPGTFALFGIGLVGIGLVRRRRQV